MLDKPLAILIQSTSAAGKSTLMDGLLSLMPERERVHYSAMTGQSLFYLGEGDLRHKILAIAEEEGVRQAAEVYDQMSPFHFADKIKEPILLIHGTHDNNQGTFPVQSERMFAALKGNGGNVRYVQLPLESHGYIAKESRRHVIWEMVNWLDTHVKEARKPTTSQ